MQTSIKPPHLEPGDSIGVVSPSFPIIGQNLDALERGIQALEAQGFEVRMGEYATNHTGHLAGRDRDRARDINHFFADSTVKGIISTLGGTNSNRLLSLLDWDAIERNPKVFCGHSDVTVLNLAIHARTGLITFDGPNLIGQWGIAPLPYTIDNFQRICGQVEPSGPLSPPAQIMHSVSPHHGENINRTSMEPHPGWRWLKSGYAQGRLIGGHLGSTLLLAGTSYWPTFEQRIWFWDELGGSLRWVDRYLTHAREIGIFDQIVGMIVCHCLIDDEPITTQTLEDIILEHTLPYSFPILMNVDCGHLNPRLTMPNGVLATLDAHDDLFSLDEPAVC
jgi:muramoyltetrapeptide carboxypeptidase